MDTEQKPLLSTSSSMKRLARFLWLLQTLWLMLIVTLASWHIWQDHSEIDQLVVREANIRLQTANHIRKWIVNFGGVYAPISDHHKPNPYIPETVGRDVETVDGRKLTIANSISALNEIMGKENRVVGAFIRFTGPNPLKSGNEPDEWETQALEQLRNGEKMAGDYTEFEGKPYYRMLQPLELKTKCFKCHVYDASLKLGDIVGGLGVNVDLEVYSGLRESTVKSNLTSYSIIWLLGTLAILIAGRRWQSFLQEKDQLNHQLQDMATHDPLTGFLNRHQTEFIYDNELARAKRDSTHLSVLLVDIDKFKNINDNYGHLAGDKALETVAKKIGISLRHSDYQIRYGGDELLFILTGSSHSDALRVAEVIRSRIADEVITIDQDTDVQVTLSIGSATYPEHGESFKELVTAADCALYKAKEGGRNRVCSAAPRCDDE